MEISIETITSVEKQRGRSSNTLKVTRSDDQILFVPEDEANRHFRVINEWKSMGNNVLPPPPKAKPKERSNTAFIPHPLLETPEDSQIVWRYMSFEQFVSMLLNKSLWFSRGSVLKNMDPYEGQLPALNLKVPPEELAAQLFPEVDFREEEIKRFFESHRLSQDAFRVNTLINCWNMFEHESYAMWKVYGKAKNSIAVKTNVGSLKNAFGEYVDYDVYIGKMNYIDYKNELIDESNYLNLFFNKTPFYSTEQELRCIILDDGDISLFPESEPYYWAGDKEAAISPGTNVPCRLNELLKEVVISPESDSWFISIVEETLAKFGYENVEISKSDIW